MKLRTSPKDLIDSSGPATGTNWFDLLSVEERDYVLAVVDAIINSPDVSMITVSVKLIDELQIKRSTRTVSDKLKEMIRNAKTKTK